MQSPPLHSIGRMSKWLVRCTVANIIINIIFTIASYSDVIVPGEDTYVSHNGQILIPAVSPFEINSFQLLEILSFSVAAIIGLYWFYRANKNIHAMGAKKISSPRMAVIWYFVPILNLWKPYKVAQQIWKSSNPQIKLTNGNEWKNSRSSSSIKIWWTLWISTIFIKILSVVLLVYVFTLLLHGLSGDVSDIMALSFYDVFRFISSFVLDLAIITYILSGFFFILMIRRISIWQEIKLGKSV